MKNFECSNSDDRRSDRRRLSFLAILSLVLFFILAFGSKLSSQSLESQLKIIAGDMLQGSKYQEARIIGKALSTSGNMKYNMELIQAQSNQTLNINLPPNTYVGQNNQLLPIQGYQWANPLNPNDYQVMPLSGGSYATLPPYDLNYLSYKCNGLERFSDDFWQVDLGSTLSIIFTYNWASDMNGDGMTSFDEFNNVKRTFYLGEPISFAFDFVAKCGSKPSGKDVGDNISFLIQLFNNANGKLIVKENYPFHDGEGKVRFDEEMLTEPLGSNLPLGKYMISVSITSSDRLTAHTITSLREYFEVIE